MDYKRLFQDTNILNPDTKIPGEFNWYPYGWKIRNLYVDRIRNILEKAGYEEWHFTDFLSPTGVEVMHTSIMPIRGNLFPASGICNSNRHGGEYYFAPTHEISVSEALAQFVKHEDQQFIYSY